MPKQIIVAEQHRTAAVFSEDQIQELIVATGSHQVGDIYLGIVENVLPGIDAAFVNIGDAERNGFIHVSDLGPLRLRRSSGSITELLAPQQKVLVQVMKEPTGNKGPRLTGNISLPGRYLVLMPFGRGVNLSRRIRNEAERNRLRALAILVKPAGMGLLVRTEAEGVAEDAIIEDLEFLQRQWESIQQEAMSTRPPSLLNRDDDFIQKVLRDVYSNDVNRIVVDSHAGMKRVKQHLSNWNNGKPPAGVLIDHHRDRIPILEYFRVNAAIREALKPRVDLPSGGYIIIERTEALTVIDVNSGSFTRSATARETVLWTNCEAATEIARQLRLRNIAGVIIVDFIDMDSRRDQLQVLENFTKALRADKARPQIAQLTELGLVELTRKRQGQNLYELFGRPCPHCGGLGHLAHLPGEEDRPLVELVEAGRPAIPTVNRVLPMPVPAETTAEESDLEAASDLQELDLLHHPSYQERSNKGDRDSRRRRRSSRGGRADSAPSRSTAGRAETIDAETNGGAIATQSTAVPSSSQPSRESREKSERGRGRREKPQTAPPQVISVEMTPEEQDIYAMMGISPLVLAPEPVKDPKSVIVNVSLPGEHSRGKSDEDSPNGSADISDSSPDSAAPEEPTPSSNGRGNRRVRSRSKSASNEEQETAPAGTAPEVPVDTSESSESIDSSSSPRRRRRRRPSSSKT
jgi:ribonuclease E